MKCKVCGAESGKYPLCRACNIKKENGEIIKCEKCGNWHYVNLPCPDKTLENDKYLYEPKPRYISRSEQSYFAAVKAALPEGYSIFPQANLASFIDKTDGSRYHNELFRNVDFLVTDLDYKPIFVVEVNDQTHMTAARKERDERVDKICQEAGIPIVKLWTSYGVNNEYIKKRVTQTLDSLPVARIHHFDLMSSESENREESNPDAKAQNVPDVQSDRKPEISGKKKGGCYIATCVYGSYDCPEVWTLRRYRDGVLSSSPFGRAFIRFYYAVSPKIVKVFGNSRAFRKFFKRRLDRKVKSLQLKGIASTPYND